MMFAFMFYLLLLETFSSGRLCVCARAGIILVNDAVIDQFLQKYLLPVTFGGDK